MRYYIVCLMAFTILYTPFVSQAQGVNNNDNIISLAEMEMPTSPAFMLLDQAPTNIERPTHAKAFTLNVLNNFVQNAGLPQNYAIEVTPYWFLPPTKDANALTFAGLKLQKDGDYKNNPIAGMRETTLSVAYMNGVDSLTIGHTNNLAVGVRSTILKFYNKGRDSIIKQANNNAALSFLDLIQIERDLGATGSLRMEDKEKYDSLKLVAADIFNNKGGYKNELKEALNIKPKFALDVAVAYNRIFLDDNFNQNRFGRFGAWTTMSYAHAWGKEKANYLNVYGIARYLADGNVPQFAGFKTVHNFDYGYKLELEFDKASIAYENIKRSSDYGNFRRSVGTIRYKLNEKLYLTGAFGENFGINDNLVTLLGINWGFKSGNENVTAVATPSSN